MDMMNSMNMMITMNAMHNEQDDQHLCPVWRRGSDCGAEPEVERFDEEAVWMLVRVVLKKFGKVNL